MMVKGFTPLPYQESDSVQELGTVIQLIIFALDKETTPFRFVYTCINLFLYHIHEPYLRNKRPKINVMQSHTLAVQDVFWSFQALLATLGDGAMCFVFAHVLAGCHDRCKYTVHSKKKTLLTTVFAIWSLEHCKN